MQTSAAISSSSTAVNHFFRVRALQSNLIDVQRTVNSRPDESDVEDDDGILDAAFVDAVSDDDYRFDEDQVDSDDDDFIATI